MKTKFRRILFAALILTMALCLLVACNTEDPYTLTVTFDFNGGNLDNGATIVYDLIQQKCKPNSFAIDTASYGSHKLTKSGYVFVGWYTKNGIESGEWGEQWDFNTPLKEDITLYARWKVEIVFSYTLYYVDEEGVEHDFLTYEVEEGDKFEAPANFTTALNNAGRTYRKVDEIGFYSDKNWTLWDNDYTHEGGEESLDIRVYVKSIPGVWTFVSSYDELVAAKGKNIWLTQDIDCDGQELYFGDYNNTLYGGGFEEDGLAETEGYTISNFKVTNSSSTGTRQFAIFGTLGVNAKLQNVNFREVHFEIISADNTWRIKAAALALSVEVSEGKDDNNQTVYNTCLIENVTVQGSYTVDLSEFDEEYTEEKLLEDISKIGQPFCEVKVINNPNTSFTLDQIDTSTLTIAISRQD